MARGGAFGAARVEVPRLAIDFVTLRLLFRRCTEIFGRHPRSRVLDVVLSKHLYGFKVSNQETAARLN